MSQQSLQTSLTYYDTLYHKYKLSFPIFANKCLQKKQDLYTEYVKNIIKVDTV